jgi:hypothetical protein
MSESQSGSATSDTSVVEQAQEKVEEGLGQARGVARGALAGQIGERSSQAGEQLRQLATAFRDAGEGLKSQGSGSDAPARIIGGLSERADEVGSYLAESSSDRLLHDVEHFGRRNPWLVISGGLLLGIAASRLLKASSDRRFEELRTQGYSSRQRPSQWGQLPAPGGADGNPGQVLPAAGAQS